MPVQTHRVISRLLPGILLVCLYCSTALAQTPIPGNYAPNAASGMKSGIMAPGGTRILENGTILYNTKKFVDSSGQELPIDATNALGNRTIIGYPDSEVDTFTATATNSYALSEGFSLTTGFGKGFADTDNPSHSMKFTGGDLSTGIVVGNSVPGLLHSDRDSLAFSLAYEFNISQDETMLSFDVGFGWSF